jgi:acyl-CoA thioesterase
VTTRFAADTSVTARGEGRFTAVVDPRWFIVRGPNGGYLAAIVLHAFEAAVGDPARVPRSLTIHYLRPPVAGPMDVDVVVERAGRSMTAMSARVEQDGRLIALALAAFSSPLGLAVPPAAEFRHAVMPDVPPPEACPPAPAPPVPLPITGRYDTRWAIGAMPADLDGPAQRAEVGGWIRLVEDDPVDYAVVAALTDAWMPAIFVRTLTGPVGLGVPTVDLTIHFRAAPPDRPEWALVRFWSEESVNGFVEERGEVWSHDGTLLAHSIQLAMLLPSDA